MRTSLLERITRLEILDSPGLALSHEARVKQSVLKYLGQLLNSHRGNTPIDANYGLPDMANIAGALKAESNPELEKSIVDQIVRYEKRFTEPVLSRIIEEDVIAFRYELRGKINVAEVGIHMRHFLIEIKLSSGGHITLEEKRGF